MEGTSVRESLRGVGRDLVGSSRLLLGAKTAIAALSLLKRIPTDRIDN